MDSSAEKHPANNASHRCSAYYDPLEECFIDNSRGCMSEREKQDYADQGDIPTGSFYLASCGLIADYVL